MFPLSNRRAVGATVLAATALALSACSSSGTSTTRSTSPATAGASAGASAGQATPAGKKHTIAFIPGCTCDPYYSTETLGVQAAAKAAGVTAIVQGAADFAAAGQIPVLQAIVQKKPDLIIIDPTDATALAQPIEAAIAAGIPVITTGNNVNTKKIVTAIAASSIQGGTLGGQEIIKEQPQGGDVAFVHIKPGISSIDDRYSGFKKAFEGKTKFTLLPALYAGNDSATQAAGLVSSTLAAHPNIVGIFASNVITATGAATAIQSAGKTGKVAVIGYDAGPQEVIDLKAGSLTAILSQNPYEIGQLAIQNAIKYLGGDKNIPQDQPSTPLVIGKANLNAPASQTALYK